MSQGGLSVGDDLKDIYNISGSCFPVPVVPLSRAGICRKQKQFLFLARLPGEHYGN